MKKNRLFINLTSNIIAFGVSLLISFVLTPYLINNVGKEAYSFYPISNNFISYMSIITMALNSMASRFITIEISKKNTERAQSYYSSIFFANIILVCILLIPMIVIVKYIDTFMNIPNTYIKDVKLMFLLMFASMIISVLTSVFGVATFAKNRMDLSAGREIFQGIIKGILFIVLFMLFEPSIVYFGLVAFILSITNFIIQFTVTKKILPEIRICLNDFDIQKVKELLSSGVWNSINSIGSILLLNISLILANTFIGAEASGDLSIVQTLPNFMTTIICAIYSVFLPRITQIYAKGDKQLLVKEVKESQKILGLISTMPALLVIIFGYDFFSLWVPNEDANYLQMLSIITIIPLIVHGNMWTIYGLNTVQNKIKLPSILLIGIGFINIIITTYLLNYTDFGLVIIPLVSTILNVLYYLFFIPIYACKNLNISKSTFYSHLVKTFLFCIIALIIALNIKSYIKINSWISFFLWGGIVGIIGIFINIIFVSDIQINKIIKLKYLNINKLGEIEND